MHKGSIRIRNKNFIKIKKKPIYLYSVEQARKVNIFQKYLYPQMKTKKNLLIKIKNWRLLEDQKKAQPKKQLLK